MRPITSQSTLLLVAMTAAAYFVAGRLGLLLAIPPGYATAVWPAAGVALAAVLLGGYRVSIGVVLGSFLVNLGLGIDTSTTAAFFNSLIVPFSIGCGAGVQAAVGGWLVTSFISPSPKLDSLREVSLFIFLAAAVSSMVNATIGTGTLLIAGIMAPENFFFNWATWWTGDAIGILIFTVLILTLLGPQTDIWRPRRLTITAPMLFCFFCVVTLFIFSSHWEVNHQRTSFERKAENLYAELEQAITKPRNILTSFSSLFMASEHVTRQEFETFAKIPLKSSSGIQALEWIPWVMHAQRAEMEMLARREGHRDFVFTELDGDDLVPAQRRDEYFPVYYMEPKVGNERAFGFDISSNPVRRAAIELAMSTAEITSTESIRLVQESESHRGIVMLLAVPSRDGIKPIEGFLAVVFRLRDLVRSAFTDADIEGVVLTLTETNRDGEEVVFLNSTELWPDVAGKEVEDLKWQQPLNIGNREWQVSVVASQSLLADLRTLVPWGLLAGGLLFSGLLGAFLLYVTGETYQAKKTAERLRETLSELREAQSQLVESEKLASLGGMMSGLAHELSTPVGIAVTAISTLGDRVKILSRKAKAGELTESELGQFLDISAEAAEITEGNLKRTSQLVKSFKDVSVDRATDDVRKIYLATYLDEILIYMRPSYKRTGHKVSLECDEKITITTMPGGLSQVIINCLNNSLMHAFDEGQKGHIQIQAEAVDGKIRLSYKDDGRGIPKESSDKVFERFYTTRKGTGGTGLGLHLVHDIVTRQLKGSIRLVQDEARGVHFEILLPVDITAG